MRQAEKGRKKNLGSNSVHVGPQQENSEKNSKKMKKPLSRIIPGQNWMRQAEKGRKKFQARIPLILDPGKKIPKKIAKKFKKLKKTSFQDYFQPKRDEIGQEREKKNLDPNSVHTDPVKKIRKKIAKKFKIIKNLSPALFLAKTG